jgi:hypothetical protein
MSNWDQLYDLEPLLHTSSTEPTFKQHSYISCKSHKHYDSDSDSSSSSSSEDAGDTDSPTWWDILDHEEEAIVRYLKFLREHLAKGLGLEKEDESEVVMTSVEGMFMSMAYASITY